MPPSRDTLRDSSGDSGSDSDSGSASSNASSRSASPASAAPAVSTRTESEHSDGENRARSAAATPREPSRSRSRSRSQSPSTNKSAVSPRSHDSPARSMSRQSSVESVRSNNADRRRSRSKSGSPRRERSASVQSQKSAKSHSLSPAESVRSDSPKSQSSRRSNRSRSRSKSQTHERKSKSPSSPGSNVSGSPRSKRSASRSSRKLSTSQNSPASRRSTTPGSPKSDRSRSGTPDSRGSRSGSQRSVRSKSRTPGSVRVEENANTRRSTTPMSGKSDGNDRKNKENESPRRHDSDNDSNKGKKSDDESDAEGNSKRKRGGSGSGSDNDKGMPKKLRALIDSDSEDDDIVRNKESTNKDASEPTADALFGDASDISTDDEKDKQEGKSEEKRGRSKSRSRSRSRSRSSRSKSRSRSRSKSRSRSGSRRRSESGDDRPGNQESTGAHDFGDNEHEKEDEPEPPPETRIDVEIPKITTDLGREIHFVKLPNFLSVETRPFDHETYEDEIDEEETLDEEGRARLKLKVENTIRWKDVFDDDGKLIKESNARFVKWSDGSMSLHLGSEIFDVYKQPLQGDHNHLYIRQGTGLQGQAVFRTKLTFRPHSTESFTHRKMTMSLADRSQKTSGIKVLSQVGMNPDQNRYEMIKKEEEKLRMAMRVQSKAKKSSGVGRSATRSTGGYGADPYHDDGSDDEGAISLAAIKNKYKKGGATTSTKAGSNIYSSDEEGSDFEMTRSKKNFRGKVLKDSDDSNVSSESASASGGEADEAAEADSD